MFNADRAWRRLSIKDRREVFSYVRDGRRHPVPQVALVADRWAEKILTISWTRIVTSAIIRSIILFAILRFAFVPLGLPLAVAIIVPITNLSSVAVSAAAKRHAREITDAQS